MRRTGTTLTILGLALVLATPATAETTYSRTIRVERSQLATPEAVASTYAEIVGAAQAVCNDAGPRSSRRTCADQAVSEGLRQAGIPELSAYHAAQTEMRLASAAPR